VRQVITNKNFRKTILHEIVLTDINFKNNYHIRDKLSLIEISKITIIFCQKNNNNHIKEVLTNNNFKKPIFDKKKIKKPILYRISFN
jgi:hypothetical protein